MNDSSKDPDKDRELAEYHATCAQINDPVLLILRVHLYTEYLLERMILARLPRGDRVLEDGNLSYAQKLSLVSSFDYLKDNFITSLRNLNKVRNRCAHERQKEITIADIELIGRPFGNEFTKIGKEEHDNILACLKRMLDGLCGGLAGLTHVLEESMTKKESNQETSNEPSNKTLNTDAQKPRAG